MPVLWPRGFPPLPASVHLIALPVASLLLLVAGASTTDAQVPSSPVPSKARTGSDSGRVVLEAISDFPSRLADAVQKIRQPNESKKAHREEGHPPYPILFVHGLGGSDSGWATVTGKLSSGREWDIATPFHASLNSDPQSTKLEDDVVTTFSNLENCCGEAASDDDIFLVNFDVAYDPSTGEVTPYEGNGLGRSNSNDSATIKQGYALKLAIEEVLGATGAEKAVLVGQSMGGLAIREYLQRRTADGEPRWWIEPGATAGHRVARVVTYATPHRGVNFGEYIQLDLCGEFIDCSSEAVRDLRWKWKSHLGSEVGRYLYGGSESVTMDFGFYHYDVNADGDVTDDIKGVDEGTHANPDMPLPPSIRYTWITANPRGDDDGIVEQSRQWLYEDIDGEKFASPVGYADTLLTNRCHADLPDWYCAQPSQLEDESGFIRGLDEPGVWSAAYRVSTDEPEGTFIDGYFTAPSGTPDSFLDWDAYRFSSDQSGSVTLSVLSQTQLSTFLTENGLAVAAGELPQEPNSLQVTVSAAAGFTHSAFLRDVVFGADRTEPYSFRLDTRKLQHFSYEPRHGAFADTTDQGFATVFVPRDVPQINGDALEAGDEIGIFTPDGNAVGAAVWNEAPTFVTAFGDESGGLSKGDSIHVRFWDQEDGREYLVDGNLSGRGGRYEPGAVYTAEKLKAESPVIVELSRFRVDSTGQFSVALRWETTSETENSGFDIQHQPPDETGWETIGFVKSKAAGGTTTESKSYRYEAKGLSVGRLRFRLKYIGLDGATTHSEPVSIELEMNRPLLLTAPAPNPTSNQATLSFAVREKGPTRVRLYNTLGQVVATLFKGEPTAGERRRLRLDASDLPSGVYFVRLEANGHKKTRRLVMVR